MDLPGANTANTLLGSAGTSGGSLVTAAAVACPVCTLYLREGISLQRHLDTHPKEQVIEALIKASASPNQQQQLPPSPATPLPPPPPAPSIQPPPSSPQVAQSAHVPPPTPYPIGPIFECSPIGTVMPPQLASFSYQQFVNNGTMMIPQYAMAPQANQMMQMLYNPYGMYQQQQVPTVQMISPVTAIPGSTRIRPVVTVAGESNGRSCTITVPINTSEPKQILPEILADPKPESENSTTDLNTSSSPQSPNGSSVSMDRNDDENNSTIHVQHRGQVTTQSSVIQELCVPSTPRPDYDDIPRPVSIACSVDNTENDKVESVLPDIESEDCSLRDESCKSRYNHNELENSRFTNECSIIEEVTIDEQPVAQNNLVETDDFKKSEESSSTVSPKEMSSQAQNVKNTAQSEVEPEQLEHLLFTIMQTGYHDPTKEKVPNKNINSEEAEEICIDDQEEVAETIVPDIVSNIEEENDNIKPKRQLLMDEDDIYGYSYRYKQSLSAPTSPVMPKRNYKTYSVRSELGSNENLSIYRFDTRDEDEDEERNEAEDNFDEADMEIEEVPSPHTPFTRYEEQTDNARSHTPLSTISGISVLRVRKDLSKPCSPASTHSFCHVDADSNDAITESHEKIQIGCSSNDRDTKVEKIEPSQSSENVEKKTELLVNYQQSSLAEHIGAFPPIHPQQLISVHDSYPMSNIKTPNLLNLSESSSPITNTESKSFHPAKSTMQKQSMELLNINEDAHTGPMNVFEFDGLQILVPSTFISESSQKAVSATSQQSMASSEGAGCMDEEVKSISMRADETMPPRGELSEQESNGCTEHSTWQLYTGQGSSPMSTSYDLMARESWEESEGSDNEISGPLLDSRSLATHFTSSLFLDRDRKTPTKRIFKCSQCPEVFDCPKERRIHSSTVHKEAGPSSSRDSAEQPEEKDIKLLDGRMNVFEDIFVPGMMYHQQPLLHQLQPPPQASDLTKTENDQKIENLTIPSNMEMTCTICDERFSSEKSLQVHRRMHMAEVTKRIRETSKCQICDEEFPSVVLFNAHLKIHPLECSQCGKYFYRKQNFRLHLKRHLGIKPFPCTVCDKAFLTKQKLDEHTNGHTGNAPVKCNLCNETFRRYSNLTQHKNRHHLNIKRKLKDYICHCGEVFHTKKKLAWHKETHDEKPKACTYCNERFIHMASLTRHMRRAHNRRFVPDAQRENENVECPVCKCIYLRSSLAVHMRVHNGERPYECQVCSKAFSTKWNLQLHKWTHAARSTKPFKCNRCSAAFYRHSDYTAHMNSHRNVRPYTCNYCGAQFIRKYNCLRHVKEHEENKAYTCDVCNKTFHRSYYLKEHLRVHSGARPYTCHICGKSSGTKSNHNKHVRIHHARDPVNTEN